MSGEERSSDERELPLEELIARVVYAACSPSVRLAARFKVPLAQMKKWLEMAYYHETRRRGMPMKDAMVMMDVSISKAALLSRQLKENFSTPEREHGLPRRIEYALWAEPLTAARLRQHLGDVDEEMLVEALQLLVEEGRVAEIQQKGGARLYKLLRTQARSVWNTLLARFDGLNNAYASLTDAVFSRFFAPAAPAMARTIAFHVSASRMGELQRFYEEQLFPFVASLDDEANRQGSGEATAMSMTVAWGPLNALDESADEG